MFYRHSFSPREFLSFSLSFTLSSSLFFFIAPNCGTACLNSFSGHDELTDLTWEKAKWKLTKLSRLQHLKHHTVSTNEIIPLSKCYSPENIILEEWIFEKWAFSKDLSSEMNFRYNRKLEGRVNMSVAEDTRLLSIKV